MRGPHELGGRLAIRAPNWVGDLVMATPVLEAALATPRWSDVRVLVRRHLAPILAAGPLAERVVAFRGDAEERAAWSASRADAALLLTSSFGAAWRARAAGIGIRAGSALSARRWLLTHAFTPPTRDGRRLPSSTAELYVSVARLLGIDARGRRLALHVRDEVVERERTRLDRLGVDRARGYVVCCPGAAFGAAKLWPPERFAAVLDALWLERGWRGVVTGGPGEETLMGAVAAASTRGAISLAREERDLEGLLALVKDARLLVVGDSGPRHVATAFGVPCVSVLGPTFAEVTPSIDAFVELVSVDDLECAPCLERACPLGHHRCMREVPVERVLAATRRVLAV